MISSNLKRTATIVFIFPVVLFWWNFSAAEEKSGCRKCHKEVYNEFYTYPHIPFEKRECDKCHLVETASEISKTSFSGDKGKGQWEKLTENFCFKDHLVLVSGLSKEATYRFIINGKDARGNDFSFFGGDFIPSELPMWENDKKGPEIFDIKVVEINRGIFCEAIVSWRTDEPSTSLIEYGMADDFDNASPLSIALVKNHKVALDGLEEEEVYRFRVKSDDIFGNSTMSPACTIKTSEMTPDPKAQEKQADNSSLPGISGKVGLLRVGISRVAILWETNVAVDSELKWQTVKKKKLAKMSLTSSRKKEKVHGSGLRGAKSLGIDVCCGCHPASDLGVSHPVGVYPRGDITVPESLPTVEGGMITCVTCHNVHGSNQKYLARGKVLQDLCRSCHGKNY